MNKENEKIKEPYKPEDTPKPPQIIEPDSGRKKENPVQDKSNSERSPGKAGQKEDEKQHLLSDDTDINDETTV